MAKTDASGEELVQAARQAKLHDFIMSLPGGYDTCIGDGGFQLSGGQRQRLAVARALLKDAPLLILDEATGGLDPGTEEGLTNEIVDMFSDRTVLIITHHLKALSRMDRVLVMDGGCVRDCAIMASVRPGGL